VASGHAPNNERLQSGEYAVVQWMDWIWLTACTPDACFYL